MKTPTPDRSAILIVRLWIERDSPDGFRARITQTLDSTGHEQAMAAASDPEDVYATVRAWVEAFSQPVELSIRPLQT